MPFMLFMVNKPGQRGFMIRGNWRRVAAAGSRCPGLPDYRFRMILQVSPLFAVAVAAGCGGLLAWAQTWRPAAAPPRGDP